MKPASFFLFLAITQSVANASVDFDFLTFMSHFGFIFSEPGLTSCGGPTKNSSIKCALILISIVV